MLSSVSISKDGVISAVFTNGKVSPLAQLAIATFANVGGLSREGNNLFSETGQSGQALIGAGDTAGRGTVQQGVLEQSNVDVAKEFRWAALVHTETGKVLASRRVDNDPPAIQALIDQTIGRLSDAAMQEIDRCLRQTLGLP